MLDIIKSILRRKTRTVLAIGGVMVGVFAFVVMGSLAEHFNILAGNFHDNFSGRIFVCEKITFWSGGGILPQEKLGEVEKISGVKISIPNLISRLDARSTSWIGFPEVIVGIPPEKLDFIYRGDFLYLGDFLRPQERFRALTGWDIAETRQAKVGKTLLIRNVPFIVKGIFKKTGGIEDKQVIISLQDAQEILRQPGLLTNIIVIPDVLENIETVAARIKAGVPNIEVITPSELEDQVNQNLSLWNILIFGAALLAGITCLLCIVISMVVTVNDRLLEIGLKKAIGATKSQILKEYISEALIISFLGWAAGLMVAILFVTSFKKFSVSGGIEIFTVTDRLILISFIWSVSVGLLGSIYPAWYAAEQDPVRAMRR